jgi:hypothetical protein
LRALDAVALAAYSASALASSFGLRFAPFLLGVAFATVELNAFSLLCAGDFALHHNWKHAPTATTHPDKIGGRFLPLSVGKIGDCSGFATQGS